MDTAKIQVYIRFGDIPKNNQSSVHYSDQKIRDEGGLSVWDCVVADGIYYPILPKDANEDAVADYFTLLFSDKPVYLVTGNQLRLEGADREPLITDPIILKKLPKYTDVFLPRTDNVKETIATNYVTIT